jgi:hypothetical protein
VDTALTWPGSDALAIPDKVGTIAKANSAINQQRGRSRMNELCARTCCRDKRNAAYDFDAPARRSTAHRTDAVLVILDLLGQTDTHERTLVAGLPPSTRLAMCRFDCADYAHGDAILVDGASVFVASA